MSQIIDLGKLRFTYTGVYSSGTTYEFNDVVAYGGNLYHYKFATSISNIVPTNTTYWNLILSGLKFVGAWSNSVAYKVGELVLQGGKVYLCTQDALAGTALNSSSFWTLLLDGIQYEGSYSGIATYQKGDIVSFGGSAYILTALTSTGNSPTDTAFWSIFVEGAFPNQTGNANKILKTDGTSTSWTDSPSLVSISTSDVSYIGPDAADFAGESNADLTNPALVVRFDNGLSEDLFAQIAFQNADSTSSTDIIAYMDNGNDSEGWVGIGIAGSQFNDETYGITAPGDGYIFHNTIPGNTGNLVFATGDAGTDNKIIFAAGGFASGDTQMEITPGVNVHIEIPTPSTSPSTGALTVVGGVGVQGDMYIAGAVNIVGDLTFGGGSTTTENLNVTSPIIFAGVGNLTDTVDLGVVGEYTVPVSPITATITNKALTSDVATLTTSAAHTYRPGDVVVITNVDSTFNGTYQIIATPLSTTFTYAKVAANVSSTAVSPTGSASVSARREFSGAVRDASDGIFKIFTGAVTKPTSTINFAEAGLTYANVRIGAATVGGNTSITGSLDASGDFAINTNRFTVTAATGNTAVAGTLGVTGLLTANGGISSSGALTFSGGATFSGTTDVQELREQVVDVTLVSNSATLDWTAGNIYYIATGPTANMTFNVTNVPTDNSKVMTINVFVNQGATGYLPTLFQIGGASQTIRWQGGTAPTPTNGPSKIDVFSFTMMRTSGGSWIVYGAASTNF